MKHQTHPSRGRRGLHLAVAAIALVLWVSAGRAAAAAGDGDARSTPHVRTSDTRLDGLIAEGVRRSPLFRTLVDRLNRSTVFVYVEAHILPATLSGRLTFVGGEQPWRYLRVEIDCRQSAVRQIAMLGHELQHAIEIANAASVVDQRSVRALYGTIGFAVDSSHRRFESDAARQAGERVRRDLSARRIDAAEPR
jgi:hypothetical protein